DFRVCRIGQNVAAFAGANRMPITKCDLSVIAVTYDGGRPTVLLRTIDPVRELIINRDVIELGCWLVIPTAPAASTVNGHQRALADSGNHSFRIIRIDPK